MRKRMIAISSGVLGVLLVGSTLSYLALGHSKKPTPATHVKPVAHKSSSKPKVHLISLQARKRAVASKSSNKYKAIPVATGAGKAETLNVLHTPVVFVSDMDTSILHQFAGQHFKKEPTIVVMWPKPKETVKSELRSVKATVTKLHLNTPVVALKGNSKSWTTGAPDTYVSVNGKITEIPGILPSTETNRWSSVFQ